MSSAAFNTLAFRRACALFATGVAVVTTRASDGTPHGLTINSFSSLSLTPPLVMVAIDRGCPFLGFFEASGFYAVNILRENQRDMSNRFAQLPEGRFTGVAWREGLIGAPWIEGVLGGIDCKIVEAFDAGDHRVLIGEVVAVEIGEGRPLVFFGSAYTGLL
ncbi:MAG: flavin reductase family protein [Bryobacteraceae bacterium]